MNDEFHELFMGIGRGELMPYASWYLTGFLMERPLAALRQDLKTLGFERQPGVGEPEDHAAALCEIMSMIIANVQGPDIDRQRIFFGEHMAWLAQFFIDMQKAEAARFYRAVGQFGERFMTLEKEYLSMTI
ncbi:MAG: TorD/DmsD family molecular chaperone [Gammaproteobacteria bacterium]